MNNAALLKRSDTTQMIKPPVFIGVISSSVYPNGAIKGVRLNKRNIIATSVGNLVPRYRAQRMGENYFIGNSIEFYESGAVKSIFLDMPRKLTLHNCIAAVKAVSFYENGIVKGFIAPSETENAGEQTGMPEISLTGDYKTEELYAAVHTSVGSLEFWNNGKIKNIMLKNGKEVLLNTKYGRIRTCKCATVYESGALKSIEPSLPARIVTPIGTLIAYNPYSGSTGYIDSSVVFDEYGRILQVISVFNIIFIKTADNQLRVYRPTSVRYPIGCLKGRPSGGIAGKLDRDTMEGIYIEFCYDKNTVKISDCICEEQFSISDCNFMVINTGKIGAEKFNCFFDYYGGDEKHCSLSMSHNINMC